jgi:hypothetical protein
LTFCLSQDELRRGKTEKLTTNLGTPGYGPGSFVVMAYDLTPSDARINPVVEVDFPSRTPGLPPLVRRFVLEDRC